MDAGLLLGPLEVCLMAKLANHMSSKSQLPQHGSLGQLVSSRPMGPINLTYNMHVLCPARVSEKNAATWTFIFMLVLFVHA